MAKVKFNKAKICWRRQSNGLCARFADPTKTALETPVFWSPKDNPYTLNASASSDVDVSEHDFCLGEFAKSCFVLKTRGCKTHVLLRQDWESVHLIVDGDKSSKLSDYVTIELSSYDGLKQKLSSIKRLQNWRLKVPSKASLSEAKSIKLYRQLRALKARQAGKSYRQIAQDLFGKRRVDTDWKGDSPALKGQVRRLVKRGRYLMEGGYRDLLK